MTRSSLTPKNFLWIGCTFTLFLVFGCSDAEDAAQLSSITGISASQTAQPSHVRIVFQAQVTSLVDPQSSLGGTINVGDAVVGSYLYDEDANDLHPAPDHGHYVFGGDPFTMVVDIEGLRFQADPTAANLSLRLLDNKETGGQTTDSCLLTSAVNADVLPGVSVSSITLSLEDDSATALSSDELKGAAPNFPDWPTSCVVTITGPAGWQIDATITWISEDTFPDDDPKDHRRFVQL